MRHRLYDEDELYVRQGFKTYKNTADTLQKRLANDEEAMRWVAKHKTELENMHTQPSEYPITESFPLLENTDKKFEILKDNQVRQLKTYRSIYEGLIIDLYWWNLLGHPSLIKIKLPDKVLKLISCRYLEDGKRSCKAVAKITGYQLGTIYNFFSDLRQIIKTELDKLKG